MSSERQKMLAGELYDPLDPELVACRRRARDLLASLNGSSDDEVEHRKALYASLFGTVGSSVTIEPPFYCDYGSNIYVGDGVFFNFNCIVLDPAEVRIGNHVLLGPAVQIYTATHPLDWRGRRKGTESARPVAIADDVWVGGGAIILPGTSIGARSVVGAGAVVTRNVGADVFVAGNPARVVREII